MNENGREKIMNILTNLCELERTYVETAGQPLDFDAFETYRDYLSSHFIRSHHLTNVYWLQNTLPMPKSIREYSVLNDELLFITGRDIALVKQINFPSSFMHSMNYYNALYVLKGDVSFAFETQKFLLHPGDLFFLAPDSLCSIDSPPGAIAIHIMIRSSFMRQNYATMLASNLIATHFFYESLQSGHKPAFLLYHTKEHPLICEHVLDAFAEYLWSDDYSNALLSNHLQMIFSYLLRIDSSDIETNITIRHTEQNYYLITNYLKKNFMTATLAEASEDLHFSKQHLCKIVRDTTGHTFLDLLTDIRLDKVKSYLLETSLPIEAIAELTGFSEAAYLSRVFKKREGISPSRFRNLEK